MVSLAILSRQPVLQGRRIFLHSLVQARAQRHQRQSDSVYMGERVAIICAHTPIGTTLSSTGIKKAGYRFFPYFCPTFKAAYEYFS
jgi:hypothetical protein